jgi:hypothetical protein
MKEAGKAEEGKPEAGDINNRQKRRIHHLASRIGLIEKVKDGVYRDLLERWFRVRSCLALTGEQADLCIRRLTYIAIKMGVWEASERRTKYDNLGKRPGMASPKQLRMIEALWVDVSYQKTYTAKLEAFRRFLLGHYRIDDLRFLEARDVGKIIDTLLAMKSADARRRGEGHRSHKTYSTYKERVNHGQV